MKTELITHKVTDLALWLLIWGEAANLRHMPECLCFLFHNTRARDAGRDAAAQPASEPASSRH